MTWLDPNDPTFGREEATHSSNSPRSIHCHEGGSSLASGVKDWRRHQMKRIVGVDGIWPAAWKKAGNEVKYFFEFSSRLVIVHFDRRCSQVIQALNVRIAKTIPSACYAVDLTRFCYVTIGVRRDSVCCFAPDESIYKSTSFGVRVHSLKRVKI